MSDPHAVAAPGVTADHHSADEIRKHVKVYYMVFGALAFLTVVTVGVYYIHLDTGKAIALALAVATVKASLVAAYFMHLISERKIIYWTLVLCAIFFLVLMLIPTFNYLETGI
jgi:cytochrome c oxidase subunit IV